jgi:hypothetical protein
VPGQRQGGNGHGDVVRLQARGILRGVEASRGTRRSPGRVPVSYRCPVGIRWRETRRTPWPAAGCNKPATSRAEETVEVVRNHADGTRFSRAAPSRTEAYGDVRGSGRSEGTSVEGRGRRAPVFGPGGSPARIPGEEGRKRFRPGLQVSAPKGSQGPRVRTVSVLREEGASRRDAVGRPRRPARQRVRSGRERGRPTTRYDRVTGNERSSHDVRFVPGPEGPVNPTGASVAFDRRKSIARGGRPADARNL